MWGVVPHKVEVLLQKRKPTNTFSLSHTHTYMYIRVHVQGFEPEVMHRICSMIYSTSATVMYRSSSSNSLSTDCSFKCLEESQIVTSSVSLPTLSGIPLPSSPPYSPLSSPPLPLPSPALTCPWSSAVQRLSLTLQLAPLCRQTVASHPIF